MARLEGADQLHARLRALQGQGHGVTVLKTLALATVREAKLLAPRKTGILGRSIRVGDVTETHAQVIAGVYYAPYVEFGTGAHDITPNAKKALAWAPGPAGGPARRLSGATRKNYQGPMVFAKRVHHPGTKAQPFLERGAQTAVEKAGLTDVIVKVWNEAA